MRIYNIFISHSWKYDKHYDSLVKFFNKRNYFDWNNYSVPSTSPIHNAPTNRELREALVRKISPCSVVVILAGQYSTYSKWINEEIKIAQEFGKPIVAVIPWANERPSAIVQNSAHEIVKWNTNSIVNAIKNNALK